MHWREGRACGYGQRLSGTAVTPQWMGQVHEFLGLTVGVRTELPWTTTSAGKPTTCDITYVTNNELGFDYLRDNMVIYKEQLVLRELALRHYR